MRVQKLIADSGLCSRRRAEDLIEQGLVTVNGKTAKLGDTADEKDRIMVSGKEIGKQEKVYYAFYKPLQVETTLSDPKGRRTVKDYFPTNVRLYPIGRLDYDSEGLLLLTNDGEFANKVMHPKYEVDKVYTGVVDHSIKKNEAFQIERGVRLKDGKTWPAKLKVGKPHGRGFEITIHEGRNRIIRRMFGEFGYKVTELKRVRIGKVSLGKLKPGKMRKMNKEEIDSLTSQKASARGRAPRTQQRSSRRSAFGAFSRNSSRPRAKPTRS